MNINSESYIWFQKLMVEFSTSNHHKNEFYVILAIIDSMGEDNGISIEELAEKSSVSTATISRLITKLGFLNYRDFRAKIHNIVELSSVVRFYKYGNIDQTDPQPIFDNIKATADNLDMGKMKNIIELIQNSEKRMFVGLPENLSNLTSFSKDLFSKKLPCYLFLDVSTQINILNTLRSESCIIVSVVNNESILFFNEYLNKAKKGGAKLILFTQDEEDEFSKKFDIVYKYGIENSFNYGNYSLSYLSGILSSLLY